MRIRVLVLAVLLVSGPFALAGEIFGKLTAGGAPVAAGAATVEVKCGAKAYPAVKTDKSGAYQLVVAETGKCTMTVQYQGQSASLDVASYADDAAQVDLVLEIKDGQLAVRRK